MRLQAFNLSSQGASHIKKNKECQDSSESYFDEQCAIAVVCDGHGGDDYVRSAYGSSFASKIAKDSILNFIQNVDEDELSRHHDKLIHNLEASIISKWSEAVHQHCSQNPFTDAEIAVISDRAKRKYLQENRIESAYGTTLIAVAVTNRYWFGIHIGDGKCVAVSPESKFVQPIPWDERCFLNSTTSICDSDALERFRYFYSAKLPVAVFVGSDGIDDCFGSNEQLNSLYKTVLYSFATTEFEEAISDLKDYLPRLSAKGSGDDVSISAVIDLDRVGEIEAVRDFDEEKEKARVEENARIAAQKAEEERLQVEAKRAEQQRQQQARLDRSPKYCKYCGAELMPRMKFCGQCGKPVDMFSIAGGKPKGANFLVPPDEVAITKLDALDSSSDGPADDIVAAGGTLERTPYQEGMEDDILIATTDAAIEAPVALEPQGASVSPVALTASITPGVSTSSTGVEDVESMELPPTPSVDLTAKKKDSLGGATVEEFVLPSFD